MSVERDAEERLEALIGKYAKEGKVIPFPSRTKAPRKAAGQPASVSITGDSNAAVIGSHNHVSINITRKKVIAQVKPGPVHITETQAATLKQLVSQVAKLSGKHYSFIYTKLCNHLGVTAYRLIPVGAFEDAENYLLRWLGRLGVAVQADEDAEATRKRHLAYIKINQKKAGRVDADVADFLQISFGKTSLTECTLHELEIVRALVKSWKPV